jgi:hypothetical protein
MQGFSVPRQWPIQKNDESAGRLDRAVDEELFPVVRVVVSFEWDPICRRVYPYSAIAAGKSYRRGDGQFAPTVVNKVRIVAT